MPTAKPRAGASLLTPQDHTLLLVDFQPQMAFAVKSHDPTILRNNVSLVAQAAAGFGVSTVLSTIEESFSGYMFDEIIAAFPHADIHERTMINAWEDEGLVAAINGVGKGRIVMAGLWTSVCVLDPALSAIDQGFEVYVLADACGDVSHEAHASAMERMTQAGVRPMTSLQYLLELQRDWSRKETYDLTLDIAGRFGGAYGLGIAYAGSMLGGGKKQDEAAGASSARAAE
jgi:nicotinamidase-related amidase